MNLIRERCKANVEVTHLVYERTETAGLEFIEYFMLLGFVFSFQEEVFSWSVPDF